MIKKSLFFLLMLITVYSRFLNLNWDEDWGFHPDENNLWGASRRVALFRKLDPEFYAYGGFPIYLYSLLSNKVEARGVSAGGQVLIVILLFVTGKRMAGWNAGFFAAAMGMFSAGLVQAGHFLTVESLLGLLSLIVVWCLLNYQELLKTLADRASSSVILANFWLIAAVVVLGLGVGTKVSFAVFTVPLFVSLLRPGLTSKARPFQTIKSLAAFVLSLLVAALIFFLTNPFIFSKWNEVKSTLEYEAKVATGSLSVFYTRQFLGTVPGWFQATDVVPYVTGWLFVPLFLIGVIRVIREIRDKKPKSEVLLLIGVSALLSFILFWAKWTRYVVQVLPILILIAGVGAGWVWEKGNAGKALVIAAMISFLPQFFSTLNVYANEDTRITAAKWAEVNIAKDAKIFTEAMDLGILPFNSTLGQNIKLFNFYELDEISAEEKQRKLDSLIQESDYFILLSRRVYKNSLDQSDKFPRASEFYRRLFDGSLGYKKIYGFPPAVIPGFDQESIHIDSGSTAGMTMGFFPEETFEVFDNPKVVIFENRHSERSEESRRDPSAD